MELRSFSNTYFAAIPADIVGCVDDYVPHKMRTNFATHKVYPLFGDVPPVALFQKNDHEYVLLFLTCPDLVSIDVTTNEITTIAENVSCACACVDRNGRILYGDVDDIHVIDGSHAHTLTQNTMITSITVLDHDMCAMTDDEIVILRNYAQPDDTNITTFVLPDNGPKTIHEIYGFHHSTNLVVTYEEKHAENSQILLFNNTGDVLDAIICDVLYLAIDSTDQIIVLNCTLHIFNSELDELMHFRENVWRGPFVVDHLGCIHCYDSQYRSLLVLK